MGVVGHGVVRKIGRRMYIVFSKRLARRAKLVEGQQVALTLTIRQPSAEPRRRRPR